MEEAACFWFSFWDRNERREKKYTPKPHKMSSHTFFFSHVFTSHFFFFFKKESGRGHTCTFCINPTTHTYSTHTCECSPAWPRASDVFKDTRCSAGTRFSEKMRPFHHFFRLLPWHMTAGSTSETAGGGVSVSRLLHLTWSGG